MDNITKELYAIVSKENLLLNEPMKDHTTFKTGGEAKIFISPKKIDEVIKVIDIFKKYNVPFLFIGKGSNLLVRDEGFDGGIICSENMDFIEIDGDCLNIAAGASMGSVAKIALENSLSGFEFASGIPGTFGGGVFMNAGAYGEEIKDVLQEVTLLTQSGEVITLKASDILLEYRNTSIEKNGEIVLSGKIKLKKSNKEDIKSKMFDLNRQRKLKQPLEFPSAGSTFKRPPGHFAGKLIEDSGLKGFSYNGAMVSEKHCGFIINTGSAKTKDILHVIEHVKKEVYNKYNINLETEVKIIGNNYNYKEEN